MENEKFQIVSLEDKKSKELARALSNKTSRQILNKLTKMKSVTQISEDLDLPMTTVQYNIDLLHKVGLIKPTHFKYSKKGRKIRLYKPTKNIIIFAPQKAEKSILDMFSNKLVVPSVLALSAGIGFLWQYISRAPIGANTFAEEKSATLAAPMMDGATQESAPVIAQTIMSQPQLWLLFFAGALFACVILAIAYLLRKKS